jgi:uncharacterized protein YodC (DUF2158 family)
MLICASCGKLINPVENYSSGRGGPWHRLCIPPKFMSVPAGEIALVAPAPPPDDPPLGIGDHCRLNSGGPPMLVVDVEDDHVVAAWASGKQEQRWPRACVRRIVN